ncbi:MAG: hypothetical protein LUH05_00840 [Candidatus Gastranaerophilales bacterium]|nr:hypothetical protein [Candidatus Gastranaerophilales bacterium]
MKKRHLRLVVSRYQKTEDFSVQTRYFERFKDFFDCISLSKNEKIYIIKDILIKLYRDYEQSTGNIDTPYFVKAEMKISQIIKDKKIDYYYNRLKKFKKSKF